ncbi:MAG TPA: carboxypeptidase regulatory-like domain-containing protein, partial [Thermoanaerobaculia bacterium]|nr:carboxypeptidase regulatory-like domain-containing protein [Thermoanaerobaculia bacterium]
MRYAVSLICALSTTIASANAANSVAVLRQFQPPLSAERFTDLRLARTSGGQLWVVTSEAAECWQKNDRGEFQRSGSWPLPAALTPLHSLHVAPIDAKQAWIVDATERRAWRIQNGTWSKAIQLPDEIGGVTALVTGDIVINTPAHSGHALAVVDTAGEVRVRFGGRIASKVAQQAPMSNTWRLTTLPGGKDIAAAHAYLPILRTYKSAGTLIRETTITIPSVAVIEQRRKELESTITVNVEECCISSKVVHFATAISADGERIAVRYGLDPKLETFALDGTWAETIGVGVTVEKQRWLAAGIAFFEDAVVAAELDRIAVYRRATTAVTRGSVIDEKGAPITGAVVTLTGFGGSRVVITTGATGTFEVRGIPATDPATVSVAADSYLSLQRAGALEEITLQPFVLHSIPEQCVIVRSALDGDVIKEYRLRIGQSKAGQGTVFRNEGTSLQIQDEEGRGCLPTPLTPPLFVRVSAKGHATREVELANAGEIEIELQSEVPLRVLTKSDTGAPVAAVKIYVIRPDQKRGGTFAVSDEVIVTTDEEGIATLSGLEANQYVVLAEHPQYVRVEKTVKLAENTGDVEIVMDRGAQLTVEVLDATTRQPLADTLVHGDPRNVPMTEALLCTTGSDGTCALSGLPVGRYGIRAEHAGYARGAETVVVGPSERHPRVVVHLSNATAISGRVAGMESYPGVSMQVQVAKPGVPGIQAPVGTDGEYRISEAPTGTVSLWVTETGVDSTLLHHRT